LGRAKWEGRGVPRGERAARIVGKNRPRVLRRVKIIPSPVRLIPRDDARSLWSRGAKRPIARFHATGASDVVSGVPRRSARSRASALGSPGFPVEPIRPPPPILPFNESGKEINLPAIGESGCSRRPTMREKTHRCDASGVRRLLTSLLFDLTRELRAVVACALCVKRAEGVNVQTVGGPALPLLSHVSRTALVYKPKK
jgi:hypothetical protein